MLKNPTKCLWRWEPDRRSNLSSPPAHLYAVACMTEISLIVTFNNQYTLHSLCTPNNKVLNESQPPFFSIISCKMRALPYPHCHFVHKSAQHISHRGVMIDKKGNLGSRSFRMRVGKLGGRSVFDIQIDVRKPS